MGHIHQTNGSWPFLHPKRKSLVCRASLILIIIIIKCFKRDIYRHKRTTPHLLKKIIGGHAYNSTDWTLWMMLRRSAKRVLGAPNEVLKWSRSKRTWSMTLMMWWHVKHCINRACSMVEKEQRIWRLGKEFQYENKPSYCCKVMLYSSGRSLS